MTVVNVGANIGYYTLQFSQWVGEQGKVYAFEPDPNSYRLLDKNIKANSLSNLTAVESAVADKVGKVEFFFCEENRGDHRIFDAGDGRQTFSVEATSLDEFFPKNKKIDLIKMDIQGAEMLAFRGMRRVLEENPEAILISEFCPTLLARAGSSGMEFLEEIQTAGFEIKLVDEDHERLIEQENEKILELCRNQYYCSVIIRRKK
jgi:FkbM family methyltransferase